MKKRLLGAYGARPVEKDAGADARAFDLAYDDVRARALVVDEDRVVRFLLVTDPARRAARKSDETPDPNAAARKMRPTEEEKRLAGRRDGAPPEPPPPSPPPK